MRLIAEFEKLGPAAYISHLDLQRVIGRALRRAGMPVKYSQGFNPHILLSFATALSVGCESICEIMDLPVETKAPDFMDKMNATLPRGLRIRRTVYADDSAPAPMAVATAARYRVLIDIPAEEARGFLSREQIVTPKKGKKGVRDVDIRPMIYASEVSEDGEMKLTLRHDNAASLNPSLLLEAMGAKGRELRRVELLAGENAAFDLYDRS